MIDERPRVTYETMGEGDVVFTRVCPTCGRFVRHDRTVWVQGVSLQPKGHNATCAKCGRVSMPFEGFY